MEFIDFDLLSQRKSDIKQDFQSQKPFKFTSFDNVLKLDQAVLVEQEYPKIEDGKWDGTTYVDQKNKFQKTTFESGSRMDRLFKEFNSPEFLRWLQDVTGMDEELIGDDELYGGGLHQSIRGAFLNVHVDYNYHPKTKYHRRLNVIVYLNNNWKDEYEGHLELWDLANGNKTLLKRISPEFNRCVIFETNEISYHGHPKPLNTPPDVNRKSVAIYYYTKNRPESQVAVEHNTRYINTEGTRGTIKRIFSALKAMKERILKS